MIAMAHQRANVTHIEAHGAKLAMPADDVERIVRVRRNGDFAAPFDFDTRFAVIGQASSARTGHDKTSVFFQLEHQPGALADVMAEVTG